jgi:L-lactate dehydrogenase (cytochrome)
MQLYVTRDRGFMRELLARATNCGCEILVLTVDLPVPGARYRDMRSGMYGGLSLAGEIARALDVLSCPHWLWDVWLQGRPHVFGNVAPFMPAARTLADFWKWVRESFDASVSWQEIAWLRQHWHGKIVIKGILELDDAREALNCGADGIVVSNHGGRQLDGVSATIDKLPPIAAAIGDRATVLVDGGIRSGLDVLKALASGADACLLGRAWIYALAAGGGGAVTATLATLRAELQTAMALAGVTTIKSIDESILDR